MKVAVVLLAVLVAAHAAPAHYQKKKFIEDTVKKIKNVVSGIWENINFDSVVAKLVDLIDSKTTNAGCKMVCVRGASFLLGKGALMAKILCGPLCKGALAKVEEVAG